MAISAVVALIALLAALLLADGTRQVRAAIALTPAPDTDAQACALTTSPAVALGEPVVTDLDWRDFELAILPEWSKTQ